MPVENSPIVDRFGKPYQRQASIERPRSLPQKPAESAVARDWQVYDRWSTHPEVGLTPGLILAIFREAEIGYPWRQCDLFEGMIDKDGHLRSQIEGRIASVAGKSWIIQAGGDRRQDTRAAELLGEALRAVPNIHETFQYLLEGVYYGWSASEITWERRARDGMIIPVWFSNVPRRRFRFDLDTDEPRLLTAEESAWGVPLQEGKWIFGRRRHRLTAMSGLMRTATWWSYFKTLSVRDWLIFADRFGLPYVTGKYDPAAEREEKEALKEAVQSLGTDGSATFSRQMEIAIEHVAQGGKSEDVHGAITALCNTEISKLINGAVLTTDAGSSYAQARVHENRSFDLVVGDAEFLAQLFERYVGAPFVAYNGLQGAVAPRLKISIVREVDPHTRSQVIATVVNEIGLEVSKEQVRQEFQLKAPASPDDTLKGTGAQEPQGRSSSTDAQV